VLPTANAQNESFVGRVVTAHIRRGLASGMGRDDRGRQQSLAAGEHERAHPHAAVDRGVSQSLQQLTESSPDMRRLLISLHALAPSSIARLIGLIAMAAISTSAGAEPDPLPSWNDGSAKSAILAFVSAITRPGGSRYVSPPDRIAVFDNDGTLWSEQPAYFQLLFAVDRAKALAPRHPEWHEQQPLKGAVEGDLKAVAATGTHGLLELVMQTHAGNTTDEFRQIVADWLTTARHPRFKRPYTDLVYQPMLELLRYLQTHEFKTYIVSGGGIEFMRPWAEQVYGIPPEQIIGSSISTKFALRDGTPVLIREPRMNFIDDGPGKPVGINKFIGRRPVFAFGNSDGDQQMLQWTAAGDGARFVGLVHHTDAKREWAYDRDSHVGRLAAALDEAKAEGWTVVDMRDDWKQVFPFEIED
jgi:phosphoglycolate phosphatase-like HAD superfamily hydrolase